MTLLTPLADGDTAAWSSSALQNAPAARPSWLAPPFESQTFAVATPSAPPQAADPEPTPPSLRLVQPDTSSSVDAGAPAPAYPDLRDDNESLRAQLASLRAGIGEIRRAILAASEGDLVRLACAVAERVAGRELSTDPTLIVAWVREAALAFGSQATLTLLMSPDLAAAVDPAALGNAVPNLSVEIDASLEKMRCEVRSQSSRIDVGLEDRLALVSRELGVSDP